MTNTLSDVTEALEDFDSLCESQSFAESLRDSKKEQLNEDDE